jgi:hypothetical protein
LLVGSNRRERRKRREGWFSVNASFFDDRNAHETCSPPRDRVGSQNHDLFRRTERADVVDRSLKRAARKHGLHSATPCTNLELSAHLQARRGRRRELAPRRRAKTKTRAAVGGPHARTPQMTHRREPRKAGFSACLSGSGRRDSNPRHLAWEARKTAATHDHP